MFHEISQSVHKLVDAHKYLKKEWAKKRENELG